MKSMISTLALGAALVVSPLAANAVTFNDTTTGEAKAEASLTKPSPAASNSTAVSQPKTTTTLVTSKVLVDGINDAKAELIEYVNTQINGLSVSGGADLTEAVTQIVQDLITNNFEVVTSWANLKNENATQSEPYFDK